MRRILLPLSPEYIGYADLGLTPGLLVSAPVDDHRSGRRDVQVRGGLRRARRSRGHRRDMRIEAHQPDRERGDGPGDRAPRRRRPRARCAAHRGQRLRAPLSGNRLRRRDPRLGRTHDSLHEPLEAGVAGNAHRNRESRTRRSSRPSVPPTPSSALAPGSLGPALATGLVESGEVLALSREVIRPHYAERAKRAVAMLRAGLDGPDVRIHRPEGAFFLWLWDARSSDHQRRALRAAQGTGRPWWSPATTSSRGSKDDDWPHKHQCIRISYADDWHRIERGLEIVIEEVRRACDGD